MPEFRDGLIDHAPAYLSHIGVLELAKATGFGGLKVGIGNLRNTITGLKGTNPAPQNPACIFQVVINFGLVPR
jgi:hypothetical protein